ncbi:MAG: hypothetical protein H6719_28495 [Sandaracinaceae bacterium]|nr:hypothetical protein [Sandaracinaceae bacterium]
MSDLDMDELSPSARALIDEVRDLDGPAPADRARVKRALVATIASGAGLAAGTAGSSTAAAGTTAAATTAAAGSLSLGVKIAAIAMVAAAVGGTTLVITQPDEPPSRPVARRAEPTIEPRDELAPREPVVAAPVVDLADEVTAEPPAEEVTVAEVTVAEVTTEEDTTAEAENTTEPASTPIPHPASRAPRRSVVAEVAPPAPVDSTLSEELVLLRGAQRAMSEQQPARALGLLDDHARRFPSGILEEEREAARVVALCQADRRDEARALAARFLRERPSSPHRARVRAACP